ncbi:MAG: hypothetical protein A2Z96_05125, partial [Spirochaetes bacterium GWB1_48_6]
VIAGMTGCGKSWNLIDEIKACLVNNFDTGKKGRPVFLIETNYEDDYIREFPNTCTAEQIPRIINDTQLGKLAPACYRILPKRKDGLQMNPDEIRSLCVKVVMSAYNSTVVLDDYDKYGYGSSKTRDMSAIFMSNRHRGQDIIVVHQGIQQISVQEWNNMWMMRLHKTTRSVDVVADRPPNYDLIKLAELIIWEQFNLAEQAKEQGLIDEKEWN